ncbi:MAG: cytochrome c [Candidatus Thiodiazotropha sp. (ex. Lucinisca nassula)]|nr:cytochrome c [Candidatus Thiodiazotropha sp. (ex. Lucinisca nassula)]MBW9263142.1 cytochrome c [Candidatus Thiodiazotropha sp. (ex. Lucinisca nassula)]MBW9270717.1 cytochrome c [Candidatus Thiodiazotropha sp. (ex. Lucinisca nassula)]
MLLKPVLILLLLLPALCQALNIENGKRINRSCALCHGDYGQGTPGTMSPRLAGLPADYLEKELKFYRSGERSYAPMVIASSIKKMSDEDIRDISEYLAGVNLRNLNLPKIPEYPNGKPDKGKEIFNDECKSCHKKTGLGKPKKDIPPVAGQYGSYIFSQIKKFQDKQRHHDDDPEDDTFDDYADTEIDDIIAYVTTLPAHPPLPASGDFSVGMSGVMDSMSMVGMVQGGDQSDLNISGQFRVTPSGDIVLKPLNQDMRSIAGLSGNFRITPTGILFMPN